MVFEKNISDYNNKAVCSNKKEKLRLAFQPVSQNDSQVFVYQALTQLISPERFLIRSRGDKHVPDPIGEG